MEPSEKGGISKNIFVIALLFAICVIIYMTFQGNYLQKQLVIRESKVLELQGSKDALERRLQETNVKLATLSSANVFLEKNNERLSAVREFLQGQLDIINGQLSRQEELISSQQQIITSLSETNNKLDTVISQLGRLYMESVAAPTSKGNKGKVGVFLTPAEEK